MKFSDDDRKIFAFHDGEKERYADPLALRRALLQASRGSLHELTAKAAGPPAYPEGQGPIGEEARSAEEILSQVDAQEQLAAVVRSAFGLPPFDPLTGQGCTESMVWKVWDAFMAFLEGEKRPAGKSATSPPPTAPLPAVPPITASSCR